MSTLCRLNAMTSWNLAGVQQLRTLQHQSVPLFLSKGQTELRNGERCMDSIFSNPMMLNSTISMGIAVVFSAALRKNFKNPSAVAPWRRAVHGPQLYARRSGGLGSGFHHWTTHPKGCAGCAGLCDSALLEWNESQVSMQLEERLNFVGSLKNNISPNVLRQYLSVIVTSQVIHYTFLTLFVL